MTRQLSQLAKKEKGVQFCITSLQPISPENKPNPLERKALMAFERGEREFFAFIKHKFFYMAPLFTEKACLKCHAKQGYKVGDIRGGISILIPYHLHVPLVPLLVGHIVIGCLGIFIIIFQLLN